MRIIVVEDTADVARMLRFRLGMEGHDVEVVTDGFDGLRDPARWEGFDVAVIDYMLPGINGADLADTCAAANPGCRRFIFTAMSIVDPEVRARHDVVFKPDDIVEVIRG